MIAEQLPDRIHPNEMNQTAEYKSRTHFDVDVLAQQAGLFGCSNEGFQLEIHRGEAFLENVERNGIGFFEIPLKDLANVGLRFYSAQ